MNTVRDALFKEARSAGFQAVALAGAGGKPGAADHYHQWLEADRHGDMAWMEETRDRRATPKSVWPEVRTVLTLAMTYGADGDPLATLEDPSAGNISIYARHKDYHDLIKKRLKRVARWLVAETGCQVKVFVDTAPVLEKPLAMEAGLGWQGKHTNLVSRDLGSWFFLGSIFMDLELDADNPHEDRCGQCSACLAACPTNAFPGPYQLDARRCISYLTIEHKGHIAEEFRAPMGNRIYGCDDCLAACPWNKFAVEAQEAALIAREELKAPRLSHLLTLDDAAFRELFRASPVKRVGRDRFLRNALIAAGNSGDISLVSPIHPLLKDTSPLVRAMAVWALARLVEPEELDTLKAEHVAVEKDRDVLREWHAAS